MNWLADGVPAFQLVNTCRTGRYRMEKQIVTDPKRATVLQEIQFEALHGVQSDYHLYALLAPHLANHGGGNTGWVGECDGSQLLFARRGDCALALACSAPWIKRSAGYAGSSDGWQDLRAHHQLTWEYARADCGNVALTGEIDLSGSDGKFVLALGFGSDPQQAARNALASLKDGFEPAKQEYIAGWLDWAKSHALPGRADSSSRNLTQKSLAVMHTHESKQSPGAFIASLAIPWGFSRGDQDQGGYHLVWSRDMVETAGGLLSAGAHQDTRRVLAFLQRTQRPDGHWSQNMWLDGAPYWDGIQMDETALPIILVDLARREHALQEGDVAHFWPMVKRAAGYLARSGPVSPQDRWGEDPGYTPFTIAAEISALLAAAELADLNHEAPLANCLREIADVWNDSIERWMYMAATRWCQKFGVNGYYVRIAPKTMGTDSASLEKNIMIKNVVASEDTRTASHLISPDALALVRFGLRPADDPRIRDTVKVIDALLKIETPAGTTWHRYNDDGYGEHEDGSPFDGTGIGRGWPLLTGERAHYELAAGREANARKLLRDLESFANESGLISEQVWDSPAIERLDLQPGRPSGSAMPLVWAHAEYLKLQRSLRDGRIFDQPPQTAQRYLKEKIVSPRLNWRFNHKLRSLPPGKVLRIELMAPGLVHWTSDAWTTCQDLATRDDGLGIHWADLPTQSLPAHSKVEFTFYWPEAKHWEERDFSVCIAVWRREASAPQAEKDAHGS